MQCQQASDTLSSMSAILMTATIGQLCLCPIDPESVDWTARTIQIQVICRELQFAAAKWALSVGGTESLSDSASTALVDGCDSPSLRRLASLSSVADVEVACLFEAALAELCIAVPNPHEAVMMLSYDLANRIVSGTIAPYEGAKQIWELTLRVPQGRFSQFDSFVYAASEWPGRPAHRNIFVEGIIAAALELMERSRG